MKKWLIVLCVYSVIINSMENTIPSPFELIKSDDLLKTIICWTLRPDNENKTIDKYLEKFFVLKMVNRRFYNCLQSRDFLNICSNMICSLYGNELIEDKEKRGFILSFFLNNKEIRKTFIKKNGMKNLWWFLIFYLNNAQCKNEQNKNVDHKNVIRLLLDKLDGFFKQGINPNLSVLFGKTLLMSLCQEEPAFSKKYIDKLLASGASINQQENKLGWTALIYAIKYQPELVSHLVKSGASITQCKPLHKSRHNPIPIHEAIKTGNPSLVKYFLDCGALETDSDIEKAEQLARKKCSPIDPNRVTPGEEILSLIKSYSYHQKHRRHSD